MVLFILIQKLLRCWNFLRREGKTGQIGFFLSLKEFPCCFHIIQFYMQSFVFFSKHIIAIEIVGFTFFKIF